MTTYLLVPGWAGSGPDHWQTHWASELPNASRVDMPNWLRPVRSDWIATLDRAVERAREPPILVAHSLGCLTVAHWAATATRKIRAAFLVAPIDLDRTHHPGVLGEFAPVPHAALPFPSHVVASDDDPNATPARLATIAQAWGSELVLIHGGNRLNERAGFGRWSEGLGFLRNLVAPVAGVEEIEDSTWICRGLD